MSKIPRMRPYLSYSVLVRALRSAVFGRIDTLHVDEFAKRFAQAHGREFGAVTSHARFAFYYALKALDLPRGSEVIITPLHIVDFINMILVLGHKPVFVDLDPATLNLDLEDLEKKITPETRVVLSTPLCGIAPKIDRIQSICEKNNITLFEDCSQTVVTNFKEKKLGAFGRVGIFSLSFMKTLSTLDGGMVITDDPDLAKKMRESFENHPLPGRGYLIKRILKNLVFKFVTDPGVFPWVTYRLIQLINFLTPDVFEKMQRGNPHAFRREHFPAEMCFRYTNVQAEMGLHELPLLEERAEKRRELAEIYRDALGDTRARLPRGESGSSYWLYPVRVSDPKALRKALFQHGIDSGMFLLFLCSDLDCFEEFRTETPGARKLKAETVFLPMHPSYSKEDVRKVARAARDFFVRDQSPMIEWKYLSYGKNHTENKLLRLTRDYFSDSESFVDVGCGGGGRARLYEHYIGVDLEYRLLEKAKEAARSRNLDHEFICGDACSLPLKDESVDFFTSVSMVEHTQDPTKAIEEHYRVSRRGGVFVIPCRDTFPFLYDPINFMRVKLGLQPLRFGAFGFGHHEILNESEWRQKLEGAGFQVQKALPFDTSLIGQLEFLFTSLFLSRKSYGDISINMISEKAFERAKRVHRFLKVFDIETKKSSSLCFIVNK